MPIRGRVKPASSASAVSNSLICSIASWALMAKRRAPWPPRALSPASVGMNA
jgi:hypothetical protein